MQHKNMLILGKNITVNNFYKESKIINKSLNVHFRKIYYYIYNKNKCILAPFKMNFNN